MRSSQQSNSHRNFAVLIFTRIQSTLPPSLSGRNRISHSAQISTTITNWCRNLSPWDYKRWAREGRCDLGPKNPYSCPGGAFVGTFTLLIFFPLLKSTCFIESTTVYILNSLKACANARSLVHKGGILTANGGRQELNLAVRCDGGPYVQYSYPSSVGQDFVQPSCATGTVKAVWITKYVILWEGLQELAWHILIWPLS